MSGLALFMQRQGEEGVRLLASVSMTAAGTPCPAMVKNPISLQTLSISRASDCLPCRPPVRAAERSTTGICFIAGSVTDFAS